VANRKARGLALEWVLRDIQPDKDHEPHFPTGHDSLPQHPDRQDHRPLNNQAHPSQGQTSGSSQMRAWSGVACRSRGRGRGLPIMKVLTPLILKTSTCLTLLRSGGARPRSRRAVPRPRSRGPGLPGQRARRVVPPLRELGRRGGIRSRVVSTRSARRTPDHANPDRYALSAAEARDRRCLPRVRRSGLRVPGPGTP
jgi:hypothetical protein